MNPEQIAALLMEIADLRVRANRAEAALAQLGQEHAQLQAKLAAEETAPGS